MGNWTMILELTYLILFFISFIYVYIGFYKRENNNVLKKAGLLFTLASFNWFVMESIRFVLSQKNEIGATTYTWLLQGYGLTNFLILVALIFSGAFQIKKWNKSQMVLDLVMILVSVVIVLWNFLFDQDIERVKQLLYNPSTLLIMINNICIYLWISLWFFSDRNKSARYYVRFAIAGGLVFVFAETLFSYYESSHAEIHNLFMDGIYVVAFLLMGISGYLKSRYQPVASGRKLFVQNIANKDGKGMLKKEMLFFLVPLLLLIKEGNDQESFIMYLFFISIYFLISNYIQDNYYKDLLIQREQEYARKLEQEVENRTQEIVRVLHTDLITGLNNRRYLETHLKEWMEHLSANENLYIFYVEVNHYKILQSVYGNYISEQALAQVGERLNNQARQDNGFVVAYGEAYFVLAIKGKYSYRQMLNIADKHLQHCSDYYQVENYNIRITMNIGIASYPSEANNIELLIRNAEMAMMQAKTFGENIIRTYNNQVARLLNQKSQIEMKLKHADFDKEFTLHYQPQVSCRDGTLIGVEALIRWTTNDGESIPPSVFIPIVEENGMILSVGKWILTQAFVQLRYWRDTYQTDLRVAINISGKQLMQDDFFDTLKMLLIEYVIPPKFVEIEITENVELEANEKVIQMLRQIYEFGISIAIDDFGTGYSSFYYLKELPIHRIKIAKELIDQIEDDIYSKSIVQMILHIAKYRDIKVIAEGVETKAQWACLIELGCDELQGYHFSKPLAAQELETQWITEKNNSYVW